MPLGRLRLGAAAEAVEDAVAVPINHSRWPGSLASRHYATSSEGNRTTRRGVSQA